MTIKVFSFNPLQENTLLIWDETNEAVIIDAGMFYQHEKEQIKHFVHNQGLTLKRVLNTHLHLDHQFGNKFLFDTYGLMPEAGADDIFLLQQAHATAAMWGLPYSEPTQPIGAYISHGQTIAFGHTTLTALHTPGHSPGSYSFHCPRAGAVIVGDVLFKNSIGRTDLPLGNYATLIRSIQNQLLVLPDETVVYCGHGPTTTIGAEKQNNPFL